MDTLTPTPTPTPQPSPTAAAASPRISPKLIGLNVALLGVLGLVTFVSSGPASAQPDDAAQGARQRGDYTAVSGRMQGGNTVVYIIDAANQELVALNWNRNNSVFEPIGFRNLNDDKRFMQRPR